MTDDAELLRRYAEERKEEAFAELVRRHLGLVYYAALRQCGGDVHRAEDVAQGVFTDLALKAGQLKRRTVLAGWLYTSTRYAAAQAVRSEVRRQRREQEAHAMDELLADRGTDTAAAEEWDRLRPVIDAALHSLSATDREAVLLRFFEGQAFAEVGARLNVSEDAARVRVGRALEKLHAALVARGVTSTVAALGGALATQAGVVVPAAVQTAVMTAALSGAGAATTAGGLLALLGSIKLTLGLGGAALIGVGAALWLNHQANEARAALAGSVKEEAALQASLAELERRAQALAQRRQVAEKENAKLLAAAKALQAADAAPPLPESEPVTSGLVNTRWKRAQELVRNGDPAEALRELQWCLDVGMPRVQGMSGVRHISGPIVLARLGERYPPALDDLRARRDRARQQVLANETDLEAVLEYGGINRALKDDTDTVALFDQLQPGDRRRKSLAGSAYDYLVESRRYRDAAEGRSYGAISAAFETSTRERPATPDTPALDPNQQEYRSLVISRAAKSIEMLAGAGDLTNARAHAQRLLAFDGSESTRTLVQRHAERAGHPELLASLGSATKGAP